MSGGSTVKRLAAKQLIGSIPSWLPESIQYEVIMGSFAYGVSSDTSDVDVYGFCIPEKEIIFPHLAGEIEGFGRQKKKFNVWQLHGVKDASAMNGAGREYDFAIYNIVQFFHLCMENNPNMVDSLFVPQECIMYMTPLGEIVREHRKDFLHQGIWHKLKGYSYQQLHKLDIKNPSEDSKRYESVQKFGYDPKFAYHVVRLLNQAEQILMEGDLDLRRSKDQLKSIRRGEWTLKEIKDYFDFKEKHLETLREKSKLPWGPDEEKIKKILLDCLEQHFGSISKAVVRQDRAETTIKEIGEIIKKYEASRLQ